MEPLQILESLKSILWGPPLLAFILGTGLYLTVLLRGIQFRYLIYAFKQVFAGVKGESQGDINPFQALMTSLAGAIGTGNIVGVATAVVVGGMGSLFWMTIAAFVGMATKFAESLLAVKYRVMDENAEMIGGPMQYMERGLGWKWLATLFAFFGSLAAIGTGNLVQINAITEAAGTMTSTDPFWIGVGTALLLAVVIIGGVKSIGRTAGVLVPMMATFYVGGGVLILALNYDRVLEALWLIVQSAFTGQAAAGGFAGATVMMALQMGVARSVFSNEAGLGISSIAAAAAKTDAPGRQAMITMTGCLMSTVLICTFTGLVLAVTGVLGETNALGEPVTGASLALLAFEKTIYGGHYIVSLGLVLFAFSTIVAWAYYGEKCLEYILGSQAILPYRIIYTLLVIPGSILQITTVWLIADIFNALMVIPNLIALIALSGVIVAETKSFLEQVHREQKGEASSISRKKESEQIA